METTPSTESNKEQSTNIQNEGGIIEDKPPDYDGPYVGTAPPYTHPTLPLPPYQEHLVPPPSYISTLDTVDLNSPEFQETVTRNPRGYHRLNHPGTHHLLSGNWKFAFVVAVFSISAIGVAIAMVIVGGMNLFKCARVEVPIYLIVGGVLLLAELLLRLSLFIAAQYSRANAHVINKARKMDFVLCLLFLWVCVGTVWVFRYSHNVCVEMTGQNVFNGTVSSTAVTTSTLPCKDCSDKVYIFAFGSMLLQYLFVLFLGVTFCRTILRRDT